MTPAEREQHLITWLKWHDEKYATSVVTPAYSQDSYLAGVESQAPKIAALELRLAEGWRLVHELIGSMGFDGPASDDLEDRANSWLSPRAPSTTLPTGKADTGAEGVKPQPTFAPFEDEGLLVPDECPTCATYGRSARCVACNGTGKSPLPESEGM